MVSSNAIAKITGVKTCQAIRKQFGKDYVSMMPTNLYGTHDNFDLKSSHVLPAMIRKFHEAKENNNETLYLGNLNALRDWGHAKDYVEAMWRILQQDKAEDYVIATGVTTSIREFVRMSFGEVGITLRFEGEAENEVGIVDSIDEAKYRVVVGDEVANQYISKLANQAIVRVDPKYYRPTEVDLLIGDPTKSKTQLGWNPEYDVETLCAEMVKSDMQLVKTNYNGQLEHIVG